MNKDNEHIQTQQKHHKQNRTHKQPQWIKHAYSKTTIRTINKKTTKIQNEHENKTKQTTQNTQQNKKQRQQQSYGSTTHTDTNT